MAAPPVAAPLLTRSLPPLPQPLAQPVTANAVPTSARTSSRDVIQLGDSDSDVEEVKEQPPAVVPMQLDDDDVRVIGSTVPVVGASASATTPKNGYSLVSSLKDKLFGNWNNANGSSSAQPPNPANSSGNALPHPPAYAASSPSSASSSSSSASCGALSLCSPSSSSSSPVMKRQRSNEEMGVPPIEAIPAVAGSSGSSSSSSPMPPVPPPHPNFRLSALHTTPITPNPASTVPPPYTPTAALPTTSSSSLAPPPYLATPTPPPAAATAPTDAMSDEELARFLQAEDEAAERQQRLQRRQAEEAAFEQFQREQGTCALCHTTVGTELILELSECGHRLCADCLRAHLQQWSASGSPTCPCNAGRCGVVVPERVMRQVLTSEQLGELQERQMKAFLSASASSYVHCPSCDVAFEAIASASSAPASAASTPRGSMAGGGSKETTEDGRELTAEQVEHRNRHRFRCVSCSANFCRLCQTTPYHLGYTCEEYQRYTTAPHCRYCEDVLLDQPAAAAAAPAASASAPSPPSATSFVARILRSNSKKEDLAPLPVAPKVPLNVCAKAECREKYTGQCIKLLPGCRHPCDGIRGERHCLPCLHDGCERHRPDGPMRDEFCNICYSETLAQAPCVQLKCGHTFHLACVKTKLEKRWPTPRVTFHFMSCPLCNAQIEHPALLPTLNPLLQLRAQVQQKANDRLTFEGNQNDAPLQKGGKYEGRPAEYAMDLYAYYQCCKCHVPYFGGRRQCEEAAAAGARGEEAYNEADLVCGGCVLTEGGGNGCAKHGKEFIEYKCKWCCNIATWFCWGNTHFCADCHKRQEQGEYLTRKKAEELPQCEGAKCPLGVKHPPNGTEFALGCGICRQRQAF